MKLPANISRTATLYLHYHAQNYPHIAPFMNECKEKGWTFYVVDQKRGCCYHHAQIITIPLWAFNHSDKEYRIYYLAHELAHIRTKHYQSHGDEFMKEFIRLCPAHLLKYELEYKPQAAKRAGIYTI